MVDIVKLCGVALLCSFVGILLRHVKGEYALLIRIGGIVLIFGAVLLGTKGIFDGIGELLVGQGLDGYASVMLRALGIAMLTKICSDICKDCGESAVAGGVEIGGKIAILVLCIPLIKELIGYATEILKLE